jgi:hypothetical protein
MTNTYQAITVLPFARTCATDGKYLIWTSCRLPALAAKPPKRTTDQVLQELRAPGNGIGDIYLIDVSAVPALKPSK